MIINKTFLIVGGDSRQTFLAKKLMKSGFKVYCYGFSPLDSEVKMLKSLDKIEEPADVLILPIVSSNDNRTVNAPFFNKEIYISDVLNTLKDNALIVGGNLSSELRTALFENGHYSVDYYIRDELKIKNCIPTAEGALAIAIDEMPITIYGSKVLVVGFGRVGKATARLFKKLGADVLVSARKLNSLAWAELYGYKTLLTDDIENIINDYDLIINTVPAKILDKKRLEKIKSSSLVIDLASKPGGVDFETARLLGIKTIWALSLPGKVAPITSGEIIAETILNILDERGDEPWQ